MRGLYEKSRGEGRSERRDERNIGIASNMKWKGYPTSEIAEYTQSHNRKIAFNAIPNATTGSFDRFPFFDF